MELMEYDSDQDTFPDIGDAHSPMQHSGWESCQKVFSYVQTIAAFRQSPKRRTNTQEVPVSMATSDSVHSQYLTATTQPPDSRWGKCKSVFSAVNGFSSFRLSSSPQGEKNVDVCKGDIMLWNGNNCVRESVSDTGMNQPESKRIHSLCGGMNTKTKSSVFDQSSQFQWENVRMAEPDTRFREMKNLAGNRKLSKRYSMQVESPSSSKLSSLDPSMDKHNRRKSLPASKMPRLSETADKSSHRSSLRSLCKQRPAKRRKCSSSESPLIESPKRELFSFKSFLILNVVISICLSVYGMKLIQARCDQFAVFDPEHLTQKLNSKVYGQHIATQVIPELLHQYLMQIREGVTPKPLVLSLQGWTGVGKNYISKLVSDYFPYKTVNKLLVPLHFAHESMDEAYTQQIPLWIEGNVTQCHVNFVILDEMDKASEGVIKGLVDSVHNILKLNATNTPVVFLLLSNSKGAEINKQVFRLTADGRQRDSIKHEELLPVFESKKPLWYSSLVSGQTIDAFVPFLPLEKGHIVQCIKNDLVLKGLHVEKTVVTDVVQEMSFFRLNTGNEFSQTGCKRVSDKVNLVYHKFDSED